MATKSATRSGAAPEPPAATPQRDRMQVVLRALVARPAALLLLIAMALELLTSARAPRTTVQSPYRWAEDSSWKDDFYRLDLTPEQIAKARQEFDSQKAVLKGKLESA